MAPHIHEKIDFTVEVFIVHEGRVLLRKHPKYGLWLSIGGHIELDEDPNEAAHREVKEETGLSIELIGNPIQVYGGDEKYRELIPPRFMNRHNSEQEGHEHVTLVYFGKANSERVITEEEGEEWGWFSKEDIESGTPPLKENIRRTALSALAALSGT